MKFNISLVKFNYNIYFYIFVLFFSNNNLIINNNEYNEINDI